MNEHLELGWERRQGMRAPGGWRWYSWQPCTEAEARRVTGLQSWQVRQTWQCAACGGTGRVPHGATPASVVPTGSLAPDANDEDPHVMSALNHGVQRADAPRAPAVLTTSIDGLQRQIIDGTPLAPAQAGKITISYEPSGRCFWHIGCKAQRHAPPMAVGEDDTEKRRTVIRCTACGEAGYYPHGHVGAVCCERAGK